MTTWNKSLLSGIACAVVGVALLAASPARADHVDENDTAEAATSKTTMAAAQALGTTQTTNVAFDRLAFLAAAPSGQTGFSSGDAMKGFNLWVNPFYAHAHDDNASTGFTNNTVGAFFGGDYKIASQWTLGMMMGLDSSEIDSKVNGGGSESTGFTIAPYGRFTLNKTYSADMTFGYTTSSVDSDRVTGGTRVTGASDTDRLFGAVGANASFWDNRWNYLARLGTTFSQDDRESFTESDATFNAGETTDFAQMQIGGTVSYYFTNIRPWFSATYAYDYNRKLPKVAVGQAAPSDDRDQVVLGIGATLFNMGAFSGDLSVKQTVFKEDFNSTNVGLTFSAAF